VCVFFYIFAADHGHAGKLGLEVVGGTLDREQLRVNGRQPREQAPLVFLRDGGGAAAAPQRRTRQSLGRQRRLLSSHTHAHTHAQAPKK
jgi:hypothetical protein